MTLRERLADSGDLLYDALILADAIEALAEKWETNGKEYIDGTMYAADLRAILEGE